MAVLVGLELVWELEGAALISAADRSRHLKAFFGYQTASGMKRVFSRAKKTW